MPRGRIQAYTSPRSSHLRISLASTGSKRSNAKVTLLSSVVMSAADPDAGPILSVQPCPNHCAKSRPSRGSGITPRAAGSPTNHTTYRAFARVRPLRRRPMTKPTDKNLRRGESFLSAETRGVAMTASKLVSASVVSFLGALAVGAAQGRRSVPVPGCKGAISSGKERQS